MSNNSPVVAQIVVSLHADGTFNMSGPSDELQCYGLLEKAKMQVWAAFMAKQQQPKPGIVVAPPGLKFREPPPQNGHKN